MTDTSNTANTTDGDISDSDLLLVLDGMSLVFSSLFTTVGTISTNVANAATNAIDKTTAQRNVDGATECLRDDHPHMVSAIPATMEIWLSAHESRPLNQLDRPS